MTVYNSPTHIFSIDDITGTFSGLTFADDPGFLDLTGSVVTPYIDKDGNELYGIDSEFGFYVNDFLGADQKVLDGDYAEGFAGNILDPSDSTSVIGLALRNAETDVFRSGAPLGTWSLGLGGATVKASTEHYNTMADVLSDQAFPGDPDAIAPLDNDLKMLDLRPTGPDGALEPGLVHEYYVEELTEALQRAIDNVGGTDTLHSDIDFDRDGINDAFTTRTVTLDYDTDGDGTVETIEVGGIDLDNDGTADVVDSFLNGFGTPADLVDLLEPNESSVTYDIAYSTDYSVTLKDDGKLLYRWGEAVKRPNDIRMEVNLELPEEWTEDLDENGIADILENGSEGFKITRAELIIVHDITNNPNDQVRPEDYENEAAIGRLPSHYIVTDPDDATNTLWVSPVDSYNGEGDLLASYFKLTPTGEIDLGAGGTAVYDPDGALVGYRNEDMSGTPIGTVLRDMALADAAADADLTFETEDLAEGFTAAWYTTVDREPFEWSYDMFPDDPYKNVYESFRSPEDAALEGYTEDALVSGPRWRLTPNKFGQDLPGLEVPLTPNTPPPYQSDNIKYETGELTTTTLNLLDWGEDADGDGIPDPSPLGTSLGWMTIDPGRLDVDADGIIDEGWQQVNGSLNAGDEMPEGLILSAITPNGVILEQDFLDTAVYLKGDRQDSANLYDIRLVIEYEPILEQVTMGAVQGLSVNHIERVVNYQDDATFAAPVVFLTPTTRDGVQPASITVSSVTSTGASVRLEEPDYLDGWHNPEGVSMLTLEEGNWTLEDGTRLEVGTVDLAAGSTSSFAAVTFDEAFDEVPTVIVQLQTDNGADWAIARVQNVTTTGFEVAIQEEEASDGVHSAEVVGWVALDASAPSGVIDWGGIGAQAFTMDHGVSHAGGSFTFDEAVGLDPLVSAGIASFFGADPAILRLNELSDDGSVATADFLAQEEKSADDELWHALEDVSGIAFETAGLLTAGETPTVEAFDFV